MNTPDLSGNRQPLQPSHDRKKLSVKTALLDIWQVFSAAVRRIFSDLDDCHALTDLYLPHDLEYLSLVRTYRAQPLTVHYDGTTAEWAAKEVYVRVKGAAPVTVACTDGSLVYEWQAR